MSDPWQKLRNFTQARIGLIRFGHACSTEELLKFQRAHALARDAVWWSWDVDFMSTELRAMGEDVTIAPSQVKDRAEFLKRPELGCRLRDKFVGSPYELSFIVSDGLSAKAVQTHFMPFWRVFVSKLRQTGFASSPIVLAPFGRVALSDEIGELRKSKLAVIFIGERPGLSSNDSMGIYLTFHPKVGNTNAQRNCISNIRPPAGLNYELAADKLIHLIRESLRLQLSGIRLKESESLKTKSIEDA